MARASLAATTSPSDTSAPSSPCWWWRITRCWRITRSSRPNASSLSRNRAGGRPSRCRSAQVDGLVQFFTGFNDVFFMSLMFFLSGLFVCTASSARESATFLRDRLLRLGLPFVVAAAVVAPLAYYPTYLLTRHAPASPATGSSGAPSAAGPPVRRGSSGCCWRSTYRRRLFAFAPQVMGDGLDEWCQASSRTVRSCFFCTLAAVLSASPTCPWRFDCRSLTCWSAVRPILLPDQPPVSTTSRISWPGSQSALTVSIADCSQPAANSPAAGDAG